MTTNGKNLRTLVAEHAGGTVVTARDEIEVLGLVMGRVDYRIDVLHDGTLAGYGKTSRNDRGDHEWDASLREVLLEVRAAIHEDVAGPALAAFERMDRAVVDLLLDLPDMKVDHVTFNAIATGNDPSALVARLREWPILLPLVGRDVTFDDAVASGRPDAIVEAAPAVDIVGLTRPLLRRLRGIAVPTNSATRLLDAANATQVGLLPSTPGEWAVAASLADGMEGLPHGVPLTRKGFTVLQDYDAIRDMTCGESIRGDRADRSHDLFDHMIDDVIAAFSEEVVAPLLCARAPDAADLAFDPGTDLGKAVRDRALDVLVGHGSVRDAYGVAKRWHNGYAQVEGDMPEATDLERVTWGPPVGARSWSSPPSTEWSMCPLTSARALREEGLAMRHCAGSKRYVRGSVAGETALFSLRRSIGGREVREATLQVDKKEGGGFRVAQFLAVGNATPSEGAYEALGAWTKSIDADRLRWPAPIATRVSLAHDWTDPAANAAAMAAWSKVVLPRLAGMTPDDVLGADLMDLADEARVGSPSP